MSQKVSRRTLAKTIAAKLVAGEDVKHLSKAVAAFLVDHKMTHQVEMLLGDVAYELSQQGKHLFVTINSTHQLSASLKQQLTQYLKEYYEISKVETNEVIDPSLVGGVVVTTPDEALDLSIRAKLKRLRTYSTSSFLAEKSAALSERGKTARSVSGNTESAALPSRSQRRDFAGENDEVK